jgi:hypothetical protein
VFAGFGVVILVLGVLSTSPRGLRSAERLAPLVAEGDSERARVA